MVQIRITGRPERVREVAAKLEEIGACRFSDKEYERGSEISIYCEILDNDQTCPLQECHVIEYCSDWRSKADVMRHFGITFDQAAEILERLTVRGDLECLLMDRKYIYRDTDRVKNEIDEVIRTIASKMRTGKKYPRDVLEDDIHTCVTAGCHTCYARLNAAIDIGWFDVEGEGLNEVLIRTDKVVGEPEGDGHVHL